MLLISRKFLNLHYSCVVIASGVLFETVEGVGSGCRYRGLWVGPHNHITGHKCVEVRGARPNFPAREDSYMDNRQMMLKSRNRPSFSYCLTSHDTVTKCESQSHQQQQPSSTVSTLEISLKIGPNTLHPYLFCPY